MSGIFGGKFSGENPIHRNNSIATEKSSEIERSGPWTVGVSGFEHRDKSGYAIWQEDGVSAALFGTIKNSSELPFTFQQLPRRMVDEPDATLRHLDGSFHIAVCTDEKLVLGTDPLGSRPIYCALEDGITFHSQVDKVAEHVGRPTINTDALSELLSFGFVPGTHTLFNEISRIPAGSYLAVSEGGIEVQRYFTPTPSREDIDYPTEILRKYKKSVLESVDSLDSQSKIGTFLSGGLDSRLLVALLADSSNELSTFTYDSNPPGGVNLEPARRTAEMLDVNNNIIDINPDDYAQGLREAVIKTGGLYAWPRIRNPLQFPEKIGEEVDVFFEIPGQGELFGEVVHPEEIAKINDGHDPLDVYLRRWEVHNPSLIQSVLTEEVDRTRGIETICEQSPFNDPTLLFWDLYHQSFYQSYHFGRLHFSSDVPLRIPIVDKDLYRLAISMPHALRMNKERYGDRFPEPLSKLKLQLIREANNSLETVPYERTGTPPKHPMWRHFLRKASGRVIQKAMSSISHSDNFGMYRKWYINSDNFRSVVDGYFEDALARDVFNESVLEEYRTSINDGENVDFDLMATITTAEIWFQEFLE